MREAEAGHALDAKRNNLFARDGGCAVGRAQVLHPGGEMAALVIRRDWPIWHWQQEKTMISPGHSRGETKIQPMEGHA